MQKIKKFSFLSLLIFLVLSCAQINVKAAPTVSGQAIVDFAMQQRGIPYVRAGDNPRTGFDCSGLVMYVYKHFGISLDHYTVSQYNDGRGSYVSKSNLLPGDLVFFNTDQYLGHVGIYIGNGKFIHSPHTGAVVTTADLNSGYYSNCYEGAKRFFNYSSGWTMSNGKWYYYDNNGDMTKGWAYLDSSYGKGWFYFDNSGVMQTGWQRLDWSGGTDWFCFGDYGMAKIGWQYLKWSGGEGWFYFNENGATQTGWQRLNWKGGTDWFYFDTNGVAQTGWQYLKWSGGEGWFYFNENGATQTGWQKLEWKGGTNWFYFDENGVMATNTTIDGHHLGDNGVCTDKK